MTFRLLILAALLPPLTPGAGRAGVYLAAEPTPFAVPEAGPAEELVYVPVFKSKLDDRLTGANPATPQGVTPGRTALLKRVAELAAKPGKLPLPEARELAGTQLLAGDAAAAVNRLEPLARSLDWTALVMLAHAHAARGEFDLAARAHETAVHEADAPQALPGATPAQARWLVKVEREFVARRLRLRAREAAAREDVGAQGVLPLFGGDAPVTFLTAAGEYRPGELTAAERAKLPADAVAVVQQLLLWDPTDGRLLWLLAELYAARGQLREAEQVFEQCTAGRAMTNRRQLLAHRAAVREAVARLPKLKDSELALPDESAAEAARKAQADADAAAKWDELRPGLIIAGAAFAVIAVALVALAGRAWRRRLTRG